MKRMIRIECPCCRNRLMDVDPDQNGTVTVATKCPRCKGVVAIKFKNKNISTEQIAARG